MEKEASETSEKAEVTETFCGSLKDKQKDLCAQFYEELAEEEQKKDPAEKSDTPLAKESRKNNPIKNFCWPLSGKEKEECIQSYEDVLEEESMEKEQNEDESA